MRWDARCPALRGPVHSAFLPSPPPAHTGDTGTASSPPSGGRLGEDRTHGDQREVISQTLG